MADLVNFKQNLMVFAEAHAGLPCVVLNQNSDFSQELDRLIGVDNKGEDESVTALVGRYVDEFAGALGDPANEAVVAKFNEIVDCFYEKINCVFKEIFGIKNHAAELAQDMEKLANDMLARDPFVSVHTGKSTLNIDFPVFGWDAIATVGSAIYLTNKVNGSVTVEEGEVPETFSLHHFRLACDNLKDAQGVEPITISLEATTAAIDQIKEALPTIPVDSITQVWKQLTTAGATNFIVAALANKDVDPSVIFKNIVEFSNFIETSIPVMDAISTGVVDLGNETMDKLSGNMQKLRWIAEMCGYYIAMHREFSYKGAILLPNGALNKDEVEAYNAAGGTPLMIAHYIRAMFKDDLNAIPVRGVPSNSIITSASALEERVKRDMNNIESRISLATTQARVHAFKHIGCIYIAEEVKKQNPEVDEVTLGSMANCKGKDVVKRIAGNINMYNISFLDAALSLIIEGSFEDTFLECVYKKLGAAYLNRANVGGDIEQGDIDIVESGVIADLVSGFIAHKMLATDECKDMTVKAPVVPPVAEAATPEQPVAPKEGEPSQEDQ